MEAAVSSKPRPEAVAWHAVNIEDAVKRLSTDPTKGLDTGEAAQRLTKYGPNRLPEGKKQSAFMRFLYQFNNILVYVLLAAGFVKMMVGLWLDSAIILGVVILNALLGFRRARLKRRWTRSAICCPQKLGLYGAERFA